MNSPILSLLTNGKKLYENRNLMTSSKGHGIRYDSKNSFNREI